MPLQRRRIETCTAARRTDSIANPMVGLLEFVLESPNHNFAFSIEPNRLYDTLFVANLAGLSVGSIRKVSAGFRLSPRIPKVTRLGAGCLRFRGQHILDWLDDPIGNSQQQAQAPQQASPVVEHADRPRRGRPPNRVRDAAAAAGQRAGAGGAA